MTIVYPDDNRTWGVDVSFYQDDNDTPRGIDFEKMKEQGCSFVFIRAGQYTWEDPDFQVNWAAARDAGIPRGAYWFLDARGPGAAQATLFKATLSRSGDWGELPPVVDFEHKVRVAERYGNGKTRSVWKYNTSLQLAEFLVVLGAPQIRPIIYTNYYYWMEHGSTKPVYAKYPLWIARYGAGKPLIPKPWTTWDYWQFTDNGPGKVLGAESEHIDLNYKNEEAPT